MSGEAQRTVIVVVDDEVVVRNLVATLLVRAGYAVLSAADGAEALELIRKYPDRISMVVTDLTMPGMSGMELCRHLGREQPHIRTLIMSGHAPDEIRSTGASLPFVRKPFALDQFKEKVQQVLAVPPASPPES
jgi:two-component system, cell cycle sensor histidine kinase and response regulator CckA